MALRGTEPESYITEYTLAYEENMNIYIHAPIECVQVTVYLTFSVDKADNARHRGCGCCFFFQRCWRRVAHLR